MLTNHVTLYFYENFDLSQRKQIGVRATALSITKQSIATHRQLKYFDTVNTGGATFRPKQINYLLAAEIIRQRHEVRLSNIRSVKMSLLIEQAFSQQYSATTVRRFDQTERYLTIRFSKFPSIGTCNFVTFTHIHTQRETRNGVSN